MIRKAVILVLAVLTIAGLAAANHNRGDDLFSGSSSGSSFTTEHIPEATNTSTFLTQFIAPFMMIALILQKGMEVAFNATTDGDGDAKKYSLLMSLAVTGMLIPTRFFLMIREAIQGIFAYGILAAMAALGIIWVWIFWRVIKGGRGH